MSNVAIFVPHSGCEQRCSFCDQHTISGQSQRVTGQDVQSILTKALENPRHAENQIAFFGGSFTAIAREEMLELLEATVPFRGAFAGIRISTRPDAIDEEVLGILKSYDVRAIELGAQSMDDGVLQRNHRGHTARDVENAARLIRQSGFELGLQMMTGLPGDTDQKAMETAKKLIALAPATVRIYPTVVLEGTALERLYRAGTYVPQSVEEAITLCVKLMALFEEAGVRIIRLGLHASELLESRFVAGAWHPAFREKCLSRLYLEHAFAALEGKASGSYTLAVGSPYLSQMVGQKKENLLALKEAGYQIKVIPDASLAAYQVKITEEETENSCI